MPENNIKRHHQVYFQIKEGVLFAENVINKEEDFFTLNVREITKVFDKTYFLELIEDCYLINDVDFVKEYLVKPKQEIKREILDKFLILESFENIPTLLEEVVSTDKGYNHDLGNSLVYLFIDDIWDIVINEIVDILKEVNRGIEDEEKYIDLNIDSILTNNQIKIMVNSIKEIVFNRLKNVSFNDLKSSIMIEVDKSKYYEDSDPIIKGDKVTLTYSPKTYRFLHKIYPEIVVAVERIMECKIFESDIIVQIPNTKIIKEVIIKSNNFKKVSKRKDKNNVIREFFINNILLNFYREIHLKSIVIVFTEESVYDLRKDNKDYHITQVYGCIIKRNGEVQVLKKQELGVMIMSADTSIEIVFKNLKIKDKELITDKVQK